MRIVRGIGMCGTADSATYPTGVTNTKPVPLIPPSPSPSTTYTVHRVACRYGSSCSKAATPLSFKIG